MSSSGREREMGIDMTRQVGKRKQTREAVVRVEIEI